MEFNKYNCISPLDYRYYPEKLFEKIDKYLSESALINYQVKVEIALMKALAEKKICTEANVKELEKAAKKITAEEVYKEEDRIKHNTRALVNCLRNKVSDKTKPYIHFTATSHDIVSTAEALRLRDATQNVLIPELINLEKTLIELAEREKGTLQIGRTHGQHAEPITFGFTIASYVSRIGRQIQKLKETSEDVRGKFSGAVGAYNASSLLIKDPEAFEKLVLKKLDMKPGDCSTQIVEPEYVVDLLHTVVTTTSILANLADDMRHLQRSEIGEVYEEFKSDQVGSSTMPHKRNPINFENVKSMWKEFMPRINTVYLDQISEHQRDLTNSASSRFNTEIIFAAILMTTRLQSAMSKLSVDKKNLKKNFEMNKEMISAEPAYILLASLGHPNAHETIKKLTQESEKTDKNFIDLFFEDKALAPYIKKLNKSQIDVLKDSENYTGIAEEKTIKVCKLWKKNLKVKI